MAEQEKRERGKIDHKEEIDSLAKENEMPLSELLKLYDIDQSEIGTGQEEDDSNMDDDDDQEVSTDPGLQIFVWRLKLFSNCITFLSRKLSKNLANTLCNNLKWN